MIFLFLLGADIFGEFITLAGVTGKLVEALVVGNGLVTSVGVAEADGGPFL